MSIIVRLQNIGAGDVDLVGGKAANLGELTRVGFPVPPGFVVTTTAYRRREPDGSLPADVVSELTDAFGALVGDTGVRVAVRSSATAEDLAEASFAGQLDTVLGVAADGLVDAVRHCWDSLDSDRVAAYRAQQGIDATELAVAVVVQTMVDADAAGVLFTANPVNGHRDEAVITAAWGLGETVVSGEVEPDTLVIDRVHHTVLSRRIATKRTMAVTTSDRSGAVRRPVPADKASLAVLTDAHALALAELGDRAEAHFGVPQDMEWALVGDRPVILQSRPITALPDPVTEVPDEWPCEEHGTMYFRASITEQIPGPMTPLFADLMADAVPASLRSLMDTLAELIDRPQPRPDSLDFGFESINGYAFYRYSNSALMTMMRLSAPALGRIVTDGESLMLGTWHDEYLPRYREVVASADALDPVRLTATGLVQAVSDLLTAACVYYTSVQMVIPYTGMAEMTWQAVLAGMVGAPRLPAAEYLLGFDSTPVLAEKSLWALGRWVLHDPALTAALSDPTTDPRGAAPDGVDAALWDRWLVRLGDHLESYGHAVYDLDFVHPVATDDPSPVLQGLRFVLSGQASDPHARQRRLARTRDEATAALLAHLDPVRRGLAERTLRRAQRAVPRREDALAEMGLAWPIMRRFLSELGARIAAVGVIGDPSGVFWLTRDEVTAVAADLDGAGAVADVLDERIAHRQALRRGQSILAAPQYLPRSRAMTLWDSVLPAKVGQEDTDVLTGNAGTGGSVTGTARLIMGQTDFAAFQPGEILVAQITTPAYTPLFAVAGGVVTDVGGVLSHGSIVAREYGIPAVLGAGAATARIRTGDVITVDGTHAQVRLSAGVRPASGTRTRWLAVGVAAGLAIGGFLLWRRR